MSEMRLPPARVLSFCKFDRSIFSTKEVPRPLMSTHMKNNFQRDRTCGDVWGNFRVNKEAHLGR